MTETERNKKIELEFILQEMKCSVCGAELYATDHGNNEITLHCASADARFWTFERGTPEQISAKEHWDKSRKEFFFESI